MALSNAIIGIGTEFAIGNGASPEVFTNLPEIKSISFGGITAETVDTTHMESPDNYREFKTTLKASGEITLESHLLPANTSQLAAKTAFEAFTVKNWKITLPDTSVLTFSGPVTAFTYGPMSVDNVIPLSIGITISGAVTVTPPA